MKKWVVYLLGILSGILLMFVVAFIINLNDSRIGSIDDIDGITFFREPGDFIDTNSVEVFQVLTEDAALIMCESERGFYHGPICLIVNDDGKYYYDDQRIKLPIGKVFRQVGIYQYTSRDGYQKTVPIIKIMEK